MNRIAKIGAVVALAAAWTVAADAAAKPERKGPTPEQRKEFLEKRIAKLSADEQRLARELFPLRDSLMRAMGDYHRKVEEGAAPRSLTAERNQIAALEASIERLQTENREVWLDLLAHMPGPGGPRFARHRPPPGKDGPDRPPRGGGEADEGPAPDEPPPPPAP